MVCAFFRVAKPMNTEKWDQLPFPVTVVIPDIGKNYLWSCIPNRMVSWVGILMGYYKITACSGGVERILTSANIMS